MKWIFKMLGFKYKILWMKTDWYASEFQKTCMVKVPIDMPLTGDDIEGRLEKSMWWMWDLDSLKTTYCKSGKGLNKIITVSGTNDYYNNKAIKNHFNNSQ